MTIYFISGLGIDRRAFEQIQLSAHFKIKHLDWINPIGNETLPAYAGRLSALIDRTEVFSLVGLSFGGMIATEIAKTLSPRHVILISSASNIKELPLLYKLIGNANFHKLVPAAFLKFPTPFTYWLFDAHTAQEKNRINQILKDTSPTFLTWAIQAILKWKNLERPKSIYHIHGTIDKVLPISKINADQAIVEGGHLMVFSHGSLLSKLIEERLRCNY